MATTIRPKMRSLIRCWASLISCRNKRKMSVFPEPRQPATTITNKPSSRCRAFLKIRNTATECLPGRVANDKIGASLGESSQRVPPTASERGVHVFFAGPRQVMAKSITKDIVQCLPNNSKLTCRFVLYLLLPGSLRLLRSTSLPGALVLGITSVLRPKSCTTSNIVHPGC